MTFLEQQEITNEPPDGKQPYGRFFVVVNQQAGGGS